MVYVPGTLQEKLEPMELFSHCIKIAQCSLVPRPLPPRLSTVYVYKCSTVILPDSMYTNHSPPTQKYSLDYMLGIGVILGGLSRAQYDGNMGILEIFPY